MVIISLLIILLLFFAINVPVGIAIGLATVIVTVLTGGIDLIRLPQEMFASLNSFPLMAAPFFILAGKLMEHGGISKKLINFANSLVGNLRGGLAYISIMACMFFAAISGSAIATTVAIGAIMIPAMVKIGYDRNFATALHAAGGTIGVIIPPSIPMVLYGVTAGVSIGQVFLAGIIPGLLVSMSFMVIAYFFAPKKPVNEEEIKKASLREIWIAFKDAIWAILMPVIILGGIYGGIFTPTEASVVAIVYGFLVGLFIYRNITIAILKEILHSTVLTSTALLFIIATASFFGSLLTIEKVPSTIAQVFQDASFTPLVTMLLINVFLLFLGTFMDAGAALIITTPILLPIITGMGYDPIHFGIIMIVNLSIGLLTPPLGVSLFIAAKVGETRFESLIKPILPFIIIMLVDLVLIILLPQISIGVANHINK